MGCVHSKQLKNLQTIFSLGYFSGLNVIFLRKGERKKQREERKNVVESMIMTDGNKAD